MHAALQDLKSFSFELSLFCFPSPAIGLIHHVAEVETCRAFSLPRCRQDSPLTMV